MNIFKKWFSKQDTKSLPDNDENDVMAYILLGIDTDGDTFVKVDFMPEHESDVAELMFLFNSGLLTDTAIEALKDRCQDSESSIAIIQETSQHIEAFIKSQTQQEDQDQPVVDPCAVFNHGEKNEFKG